MKTQVNGISLAYDTEGAGPALLLCHSLGMNRHIWYHQVPVFSRRYQVVTFDARGHGESDKPAGPYSFDQFAEDAYGLLQGLGISRAAVLGLSMGGNLAQALAAAHPELVHALILVDTTAWYGAEAEKNWEQRAREVEEKGLASIVDVQLSRWFSQSYRERNPDVMQRFANWLTANDVAGYTATQRALGKVDMRAADERIACPTLILVGENDPATPPAMAEELHRRISGSKLMLIPYAQHMSPIEQPDAVNSAVMEFLSEIGH